MGRFSRKLVPQYVFTRMKSANWRLNLAFFSSLKKVVPTLAIWCSLFRNPFLTEPVMNPNWSKKHEAPSNKIQVWGEHCLQPVWYLFGVQNEGFQKRSSSIPTSLGDNHFKRQKLKQLPLLWSPRLSVHVAKCLAVAFGRSPTKWSEILSLSSSSSNESTNEWIPWSSGVGIGCSTAPPENMGTSHLCILARSWSSIRYVVGIGGHLASVEVSRWSLLLLLWLVFDALVSGG